jgi:hypothetical protein
MPDTLIVLLPVFDREDYPKIYSLTALGCVLDLNPGDN